VTDVTTPPLAFDASAPLATLLNQRNAILAHLNGLDEQPEADHDAGCEAINRIESVILDRQAQTPMDAIVRLLVLVQTLTEGACPTDAQATAAIVDAQRHFGIGYVDARLCPEVIASFGPLPLRQNWQTAWDAHEAALAADVPVNARYEAADKAGEVPEALMKEWDQSGTRMGDAEWALFETPAPDLAALLWKMKMIGPRDLCFGDNIAANLIGDVERLGGAA
jgi:hypothetical protein